MSWLVKLLSVVSALEMSVMYKVLYNSAGLLYLTQDTVTVSGYREHQTSYLPARETILRAFALILTQVF